MDLLSLLLALVIALILIGLIFWATRTLGAALAIPAPVMAVVQVLLVVLIVIGILGWLQGGLVLPFPRR